MKHSQVLERLFMADKNIGILLERSRMDDTVLDKSMAEDLLECHNLILRVRAKLKPKVTRSDAFDAANVITQNVAKLKCFYRQQNICVKDSDLEKLELYASEVLSVIDCEDDV